MVIVLVMPLLQRLLLCWRSSLVCLQNAPSLACPRCWKVVWHPAQQHSKSGASQATTSSRRAFPLVANSSHADPCLPVPPQMDTRRRRRQSHPTVVVRAPKNATTIGSVCENTEIDPRSAGGCLAAMWQEGEVEFRRPLEDSGIFRPCDWAKSQRRCCLFVESGAEKKERRKTETT